MLNMNRNKTSTDTMVSIGMPVYNGREFIRKALDSLLNQTHTNFELIISDNQSTDNTEIIVQEYAKKDNRIKYVKSEKNKGAISNLNKVFSLAKYDYFMWASHDDFWSKNYIELCLEGFNYNNNIVLSTVISSIVDSHTENEIARDHGLDTTNKNSANKFISYRKYLRTFPGADCIFYGLFDRKALSKVMPMQNVVASDHILLSKLSLNGDFYRTPINLFYKRDGGACESINRIVESIRLEGKLLTSLPYMAREYFFQKIIFKTQVIKFHEKLTLSLWSLHDYLDFRFYSRVMKLLSRFLR